MKKKSHGNEERMRAAQYIDMHNFTRLILREFLSNRYWKTREKSNRMRFHQLFV